MNIKLTDDAVAELPLHRGRAELLEEIMTTPVLDDRPVRAERPRRRTTWIVPVAAAAVVAALAGGSAWWVASDPGSSGHGGSGLASQPTGPAGEYVVLAAPGWVVTSTDADQQSGEMTYENGSRSLDVMWGPADSYDGYVEDRRHIVDPPADGEPIEVLGKGAQMWAYGPQDHTAIREVEDGTWIEFRGDGMREDGFLALLDDLELVDEAAFEAALPDSFVTSDERPEAIAEILDGIADVAQPLLPPGVERSSITSEQSDAYQLGADVAGAVACAWLDEYAEAKRTGDDRSAQRAMGIFTTVHDWPVLNQMDESGGYPEVVWEYAAKVLAGEVPQGYPNGLGCATR
jgi:hypothetical protein